jgi:hypothetical protein
MLRLNVLHHERALFTVFLDFLVIEQMRERRNARGQANR